MSIAEVKLGEMRLSFQYGKVPKEVTDREIRKEPSKRAKKLRDDYLNAKISLDIEFPYWYTRKWIEEEGQHPLIRRALALKCGFEHLTPMIRAGELLVMQKTRYIRGAFVMPWTANRYPLSIEERMEHEAEEASKMSLEEVVVLAKGGGNVTQSAGNVLSISGRFGIRREEFPMLVEVCRYWKNKSSEDTCFMWAAMHPKYDQYLNMKKAVLMHVDLEYSLRHGRNVVNYQLPLQIGFKGMIDACTEKINANIKEGNADKIAFWKATIIVIEGVQAWIRNYAKEAKRLAAKEKNVKQKQEFEEIAGRLEWIAENPPRTFIEALQLCWTCHIAVVNELQISGLSPGRLGQVLYPFWKQDIKEGRITREQTLEILECMRVKFTEIEIAQSVGTIGLTGGSTFNNLCIGGVNPDGTSAENELEELIIESAMTCATPQPTLTVLYDGKLSEKFLLKAIECNKIGTGYPAWVNNRVAMEYLMKTFKDEGITLEDARAWTIGGCLEIQPGALVNGRLGAGSYSSTGVGFINMPKVLELVLWDGVDPRTKVRVFPPHGSKLETYEELYRAWQQYFYEVVTVFEEMYNLKAAAMFNIDNPIFYSALMADCIEKGLDMDRGGCRYNRTLTTWITGQVNLANSLASIKKNVYEERNFTLDELKNALINNFGYRSALETSQFSLLDQKRETDEWARIHSLCVNAPKYGNDDPYVDEIYKDVIEYWRDVVPQVKDVFGRPWVPCQLSVASHGPLGQACIASADGRLAGLTLADAAQSPYPGTDLNGPYAVLNSAVIIDHSDYQNTQLNLKVHPSCIKGTQGSRKLLELIKAYMDKGGYHIQFNVVDTRMLRDAQDHPENYRDLLVRVAGFTAYWVELSKPIQDEIIARTEYGEI
ncbi:MAG: MFS transporter [Clostridia bacterium]|nr:MAG: MFS transporter [Clostridia bacterium]